MVKRQGARADDGEGLFYDARLFGEFNFGPFQQDPAPPPGLARLYHGTSVKAAEQITRSGFRAVQFDVIIAEVANRFRLSEVTLRKRLSENGTFHAARRVYADPAVYFTDSPLRAELWGRWGGEARVEAIGAAVAILRETESRIPEDDPDVLAVLDHQPTVMAVDIPYASLLLGGNALVERVKLEERQPNAELGALRRIIDCSVPAATADWQLVSTHQVEQTWNRDALERELGLPWSGLTRPITEGLFPAPDERSGSGDLWWDSSIQPLEQYRESIAIGRPNEEPVA